MTIEIKRNAEEIVLEIVGRLDTTTAPALDKTIGENINEIERIACEKTGSKYAVALASGTSALHLAVKLAGVGEGDIVLCHDDGNPNTQDSVIGDIVLDRTTIEAAAKGPVRLSILTTGSTTLNDGDRLYLEFRNVQYNNAPFKIPVRASITYTK